MLLMFDRFQNFSPDSPSVFLWVHTSVPPRDVIALLRNQSRLNSVGGPSVQLLCALAKLQHQPEASMLKGL